MMNLAVTGKSFLLAAMALMAVSVDGANGAARRDKDNGNACVETGHEYVDMGLSVKWATCNLGAEVPEDYGWYVAWGETGGGDCYEWSTYKYCKGDYDRLTKYCAKGQSELYGFDGFADDKSLLERKDDAASANWGGKWRMPTPAEWDELLNSDNCLWIWTTLNGVPGYKVVSKKIAVNANDRRKGLSERSIFLPAAGFRDSYYHLNAGDEGYYWCSANYRTNPFNAWYVRLYSSDYFKHYANRKNGFSVRPVCP